MTYSEIDTQLAPLLKDLLYISESENPVEQLPWDVNSEVELLKQISDYASVPQQQLQKQEFTAFFSAVQRSADPADEAMVAYAQRYKALQDFLEKNLKDLQVIKAGSEQVHVFIAGFTIDENKGLVLHTIAIET